MRLIYQRVLPLSGIIGLILIRDVLVQFVNIKQKHLRDKKVLRQDRYFSTRLLYINKKNYNFFDWVITKYDTTEDMNNKKQEIKCKTKLKLYQKISNC